ncbi:MAG: hypothetical protein H6647_06770 [Anaerolineales bacterium]|nr:hypothetical protein [Anaerolineales bacterium]
MQSYTTYDNWLDERNYEKYISETAPEFILFTMGDIDRRHRISRSRRRRALLTHYEIVQRTPDFLLLQRRAQPLEIDETPGPAGTAPRQYIELPSSDGLQFITADISTRCLAGWRAFISPGCCGLQSSSRTARRAASAIKTMVNDQALVDPFFETLDDAETYLESLGSDSRREADSL